MHLRVGPDLIRARASLRTRQKGSPAPDQVRGDDGFTALKEESGMTQQPDPKQPDRQGSESRPQQAGEAETTRFGMEDGDNTDIPAPGGPTDD